MGLGYVRIPDPRGRGHRADALTLEHAMGRANPNWAAQSGSPVAERCRGGGALNVATKPILIVTPTLPTASSTLPPVPACSGLAAISDFWALTKSK